MKIKKFFKKIVIFLWTFSWFVSTVYAAPEISRTEADEPTNAEVGLSLNPSIIRLSGEAGMGQQAKVRIYNMGTKASLVEVEISDMMNQVDSKGQLKRIYAPGGSTELSLAKWVSLKGAQFLLPPKSMREIDVTVSPPPNMTGGARAVLFFKGTPVSNEPDLLPSNKPLARVMIQPRLGVLVFYEVAGTIQRTGQLVGGEFRYIVPTDDAPFKISYEFENTGNTDILLSGTFHILDEKNALVVKESLNAIRTFPKDRGSCETVWQGDLSPGRYHLIISLELGPDATEVIVREYDFEIKS